MAIKPLKTITFPGLPNTYAIPEVDSTLTQTGKAADAKETGDAISDLQATVEAIEPGLSDAAKTALLNCFQHVAWIDERGQDYYDVLEDALYQSSIPTTLLNISAVFNQGQNTVYTDDSLNSLKQYLTVTAHYDDNTSSIVTGYTLSGTLTVGTSTITVMYGGKTTTFNVTVSSSPWIYDWSVSSGTNPPGMTGSFDSTAEQGALKVTIPNLDIDIDAANWEAIVECKFVYETQLNNPKFSLNCFTASDDNFNITVQPNPAASDSSYYTKIAVVQNWNTATKEFLDYVASTYRVYKFIYSNETLNIYFNETLVKSYTKIDTSQHTSANKFVIRCAGDATAAVMFIKSIRVRTL